MKYLYISILFSHIFFSCQTPKGDSRESHESDQIEAREDSAELRLAYDRQAQIKNTIIPVTETDPVGNDPDEDAADDPAIWINHANPEASLVFGTNKKSGIHVFDLQGSQTTFYAEGKINNIDIRQKVEIGHEVLDLLGGSNRSDNSIVLYKIDTTGQITNLLERNFQIDTTLIDEVYGFSMYKNTDNKAFAIINGKNGNIHIYQLISTAPGAYSLLFIHNWQLNSQPEGMVADDERGYLYVGEEDKGIWKISLNDLEKNITILSQSQKENNAAIDYDIEGLAMYYGKNNNGFLLASIQGSFSYALFDRDENNYLGSFYITGSGEVDGVEETDGLEIYSWPIGQTYPSGMLVVQDGFNYRDSLLLGQNYKYIDLKQISQLIDQE